MSSSNINTAFAAAAAGSHRPSDTATVLPEGANPMQSLDVGGGGGAAGAAGGNKQGLQALTGGGDPFEPYANGNGGEAGHLGAGGSSRRMTADRLASFNSSLAGPRLFDRSASQAALLGPRRPRPHKIWKKKFIKVLVVGDSGLGKTTLIKTLLSTPGERLQVHDGSFTPADQFLRDPDSLCSTVTWKDEEDRLIWVYRVQDTPGYGDDLDINNHIALIASYLSSRNESWLRLESAADRASDLSEVEDPRVDVCLFCLPPHRLRAIDIKYMAELSRHVPIVPVITKADTMTIREAQNYKQEVFSRLQNPNIPGVRGRIRTFAFDKESLERAGLGDVGGGSTPPFLVIASNDVNEELNAREHPVFWPERRYPWGVAEAFEPSHSDLIFLRALLLKEALEDICKDKRSRYETWRRHRLTRPQLGRRARRFALSTLVPVALALFAARRGVDLGQVRDTLGSAGSKLLRLGSKRAGGSSSSSTAPVEPLPPPPPPPAPPVVVVAGPVAAPAAAAAPPVKKGPFGLW